MNTFNDLRMAQVTTNPELEVMRHMRQKYFFDRVPIDDPYTWTFSHLQHTHFVLYKGIEVIGYAHIQLWPENRAAMRIIVIDEPYRNQGMGSEFLRLCEAWLSDQKVKKLLVQASPDACRFYCNNGYEKMPFNDPDGYESDPRDSEVGKNLSTGLLNITPDLARKLIDNQFPEYVQLTIVSVEKQGHDNRTYRLGDHMLIRMPTGAAYALKVPKEQTLLPKLASHLSVNIPVPVKMGLSSEIYPYPFSIYKWLEGESINLLTLDNKMIEQLAFDLAKFLKELHKINNVKGPEPGQHNWWRGDHISVYDKGAREQIEKLSDVIDAAKALKLWELACKTKWNKPPVWIHGDFAIGNILIKDGKLSAIIDFGGIACGDPACDLVIAWTFLDGSARNIFMREMDLDEDTWLRAKAWALWKATYELCQITDRDLPYFAANKKIIDEVLQ